MSRRLPALLALSLLACAEPATTDTGDTDTDLPGDPVRCDVGTLEAPVTMGHRVVSVTYDLPYEDTPRTIPVHIWYPSTTASGPHPTYIDTFEDQGSFEDAPYAFADSNCTAPVYAYSHGSQAWAGNTTEIVRPLVERGWVIVGPDHLGNILTDGDSRPPGFDLTRALDMVATLDTVDDLPSTDVLAGRLLTDRVVLGGHSYGGQTAWLMSGLSIDMATVQQRCDDESRPASECTQPILDAHAAWEGDPRIAAVVPLDGSIGTDLASATTHLDRDVPVLMMTAGTGRGTDVFATTGPDVTWVAIEDACHETFTTTPLPCPGVAKQDGYDIVHAYLVPFAELHGLGGTDAAGMDVLDGTTEVSELVTLQIK